MQATHKRGVLSRLALVFGVLAAAALLAPLAAVGGGSDDPLRVRFEQPVTFSEATPECPAGVVDFGISALGKSGSATNCLQDEVPAACPPVVAALFCLERHADLALRLQGGKIKAEVTLFESFNCGDPDCLTFAIDQQWSGPVVYAKGRFAKLRGGSVSGGGTVLLDAATFEFLSVDEEIVISRND
jgi:hypothetical protein